MIETKSYKLAPRYGTAVDSSCWFHNVSVKFKVTWRKN